MAHGIGLYSNQPKRGPVEGASFERVSASDKERAGPRRGLSVMSSVFHGDGQSGLAETLLLQVGRVNAFHWLGPLHRSL